MNTVTQIARINLNAGKDIRSIIPGIEVARTFPLPFSLA